MTKNNSYNDEYSCTNVDIDDSNWREEYKNYTSNSFHLELLDNGAKSLAQSWMLNALPQDYKRKKGIKEPEPPDCQSSLKESLQIFDDYSDPYGGH